MARIYVSSSWKNEHQPILVEELRNRGHEVYDFRHPNGRNDRNVWETYFERLGMIEHYNKGTIGAMDFRESLEDKEVLNRFNDHYNAMLQSDICILLLPCGRSSHVEAGFMKGLGKRVFVLDPCFNVTPELMYLCFDDYYYDQDALLNQLSLFSLDDYCKNCSPDDNSYELNFVKEGEQCDCIEKAEHILSEKVGVPVVIETSLYDDGTERVSLHASYKKPMKDSNRSKDYRIDIHPKYCPICGKPYNKAEIE